MNGVAALLNEFDERVAVGAQQFPRSTVPAKWFERQAIWYLCFVLLVIERVRFLQVTELNMRTKMTWVGMALVVFALAMVVLPRQWAKPLFRLRHMLLPSTWDAKHLRGIQDQITAAQLREALGFDLTRAEEADFRACVAAGVQREYPGGPRQMANEVEMAGEKGLRVSAACGNEIFRKFAASWSDRFDAWYARRCASCGCAVKEARRHYGTPAMFVSVEETASEQRSAADREKFDAIATACVH